MITPGQRQQIHSEAIRAATQARVRASRESGGGSVGETGPQGPQGPQGDAGPQGDQGDPGESLVNADGGSASSNYGGLTAIDGGDST